MIFWFLTFQMILQSYCHLISRVKNPNEYVPRDDLSLFPDSKDAHETYDYNGVKTFIEKGEDEDYDVDKDPEVNKNDGEDLEDSRILYRPTVSWLNVTTSHISDEAEYSEDTGWPTLTIKLVTPNPPTKTIKNKPRQDITRTPNPWLIFPPRNRNRGMELRPLLHTGGYTGTNLEYTFDQKPETTLNEWVIINQDSKTKESSYVNEKPPDPSHLPHTTSSSSTDSVTRAFSYLATSDSLQTTLSSEETQSTPTDNQTYMRPLPSRSSIFSEDVETTSELSVLSTVPFDKTETTSALLFIHTFASSEDTKMSPPVLIFLNKVSFSSSLITTSSTATATSAPIRIKSPTVTSTSNYSDDIEAWLRYMNTVTAPPTEPDDNDELQKLTSTIKTTTKRKKIIAMRVKQYPDVNKPGNWKCYTCGLDKTKYGHWSCYDIFDGQDQRWRYARDQHTTACKGNNKYIGGCFKRYVDIGIEYNERGCREWPPAQGKSYVSNLYARLEYMLRYRQEGCVSSPNAVLIPFADSLHLYARAHVCVCRGKYCNTATYYQHNHYLTAFDIFILVLYNNDFNS